MPTLTQHRDNAEHTSSDRLVLFFVATERLLIAADEVRIASNALLTLQKTDDCRSGESEAANG